MPIWLHRASLGALTELRRSDCRWATRVRRNLPQAAFVVQQHLHHSAQGFRKPGEVAWGGGARAEKQPIISREQTVRCLRSQQNPRCAWRDHEASGCCAPQQAGRLGQRVWIARLCRHAGSLAVGRQGGFRIPLTDPAGTARVAGGVSVTAYRGRKADCVVAGCRAHDPGSTTDPAYYTQVGAPAEGSVIVSSKRAATGSSRGACRSRVQRRTSAAIQRQLGDPIGCDVAADVMDRLAQLARSSSDRRRARSLESGCIRPPQFRVNPGCMTRHHAIKHSAD